MDFFNIYRERDILFVYHMPTVLHSVRTVLACSYLRVASIVDIFSIFVKIN